MLLHRDAGDCWPHRRGLAEDVPLAIAEAVLAANGWELRLAHAVAARARPAETASMCFTSIDILAAAGRWWSKSLRRPRAKRHCDDDAPKRLASSAWGSPLAKPAAARWHLHINAGNGLAAGPPSHRAAPPDGGNPGKMSKQQPGLLPRDAFAHQRRQRAGCWAAIAPGAPGRGQPR